MNVSDVQPSIQKLQMSEQSCGFQSQHHLLRSFKKVVRQTPGEYRRSYALKHVQG